jgi:alkylated DNA repair protein (DNA oxidative demethylase)
MTSDLFAQMPRDETLGEGACLLGGFALPVAEDVLAAVSAVTAVAPFRQMVTPGGYRMSVAMSNCGVAGWVTDRSGYRYAPLDPDSNKPWPAMPAVLADLAQRAAAAAGYAGFAPDACLINRYVPGARMALHQDKDELYQTHPIVSVSLGLTATFLFGGKARADKPQRVALTHGDVVVWGGPTRTIFHGIAPLRVGDHPLVGAQRINLTFRKAL